VLHKRKAWEVEDTLHEHAVRVERDKYNTHCHTKHVLFELPVIGHIITPGRYSFNLTFIKHYVQQLLNWALHLNSNSNFQTTVTYKLSTVPSHSPSRRPANESVYVDCKCWCYTMERRQMKRIQEQEKCAWMIGLVGGKGQTALGCDDVPENAAVDSDDVHVEEEAAEEPLPRALDGNGRTRVAQRVHQ
jgi:hypothetical protein